MTYCGSLYSISLQGFICPQCMTALSSVEELHRHWEDAHNDSSATVRVIYVYISKRVTGIQPNAL